MNVKNFLPGNYIVPVPIGLVVTVQYGQIGLAEKILCGPSFHECTNDLTTSLLDVLVSEDIVPKTISLRGGTTWVSGVLYSPQLLPFSGKLIDHVDDYVSNICADPKSWTFYAYSAESKATLFRGAGPIRNWLQMSKFNIIMGFLCPLLPSLSKLKELQRHTWEFNYDPQGYIEYNTDEITYHDCEVTQHTVVSIDAHLDNTGYISSIIKLDDNTTLSVDYSVAAKYNLTIGSRIISTSIQNIANVINNGKHSITDYALNCAFCGRPIVPIQSPVCCADKFCMSTRYPDVVHLLKTLNLPELSYDSYKKYCVSHQLMCVADVLDLPEYSKITFNASITLLLEAIIPVTAVANRHIISQFVNKCSNNIRTIQYYITNSDKLMTDLELDLIWGTKLQAWLSESNNAMQVTQLIQNSNICIDNTRRKFEGTPMFRNYTFYITGTFEHGSTSDIVAILQSYDGTVESTYSDKVTCIIVGDIAEDVNGVAVRDASNKGISIMRESEFFNRFDIDTDLAENLV